VGAVLQMGFWVSLWRYVKRRDLFAALLVGQLIRANGLLRQNSRPMSAYLAKIRSSSALREDKAPRRLSRFDHAVANRVSNQAGHIMDIQARHQL
jgi:hypothetical protein